MFLKYSAACLENTLSCGVDEHRETTLETMSVFQGRDDGGLDQGSNSSGG